MFETVEYAVMERATCLDMSEQTTTTLLEMYIVNSFIVSGYVGHIP